MRIAVVQNRTSTGVINRFGQRCPETYGQKTIQRVADSLREQGHLVSICEGDKTQLSTLECLMPPDEQGQPTGMVFNMAYGIQGDSRYTHVPAMLEMAGVPYTGSGPLGHAVSLDKVITKILLLHAGVPTPKFQVMRRAGEKLNGIAFPLVVKPRHESTSFALRLVHDEAQLADAVENIATNFQQDALLEEYIDGREICVALLGNEGQEEIEVLPFVEQDFSGREDRLVTWEDKSHKGQIEFPKICPAAVSRSLASRLREISLTTFRACHCKDYARVDIRIDAAGAPFVLEINSMASLGPTASYVLAAENGGYSYSSLVNRIVDVAHIRYFGVVAPRQGLASADLPAPLASRAR